MAQQSKWQIIETRGKVYLYTANSIEDYESTNRGSYYSQSEPPGKALSKADCLAIAKTLLRHA